MPGTSRFLYIVTMDVDPEHEELFNTVYDQEHVPNLLKVRGVVSAARFRRSPAEFAIGGERRPVDQTGTAKYYALYEFERSDVLVSEEWQRARDLGRWPDLVRPFTRNERRFFLERI